jgi:hypothetical protein
VRSGGVGWVEDAQTHCIYTAGCLADG